MALRPTQLPLPFDEPHLWWAPTPCEVEPTPCEVEPSWDCEEGRLFALPPTTKAKTAFPTYSGASGDDAERIFSGICTALKITAYRAPVGNAGHDFLVNGARVEVKATQNIKADGRFAFKAGRKRRFADYAGKADYFVFVLVVPSADLYGRMVVMTIDQVLRRWPGPTVSLRLPDFPREPDLSLLAVSDGATVNAEAGGGADLAAAVAHRGRPYSSTVVIP
jgi:hypothetical protein